MYRRALELTLLAVTTLALIATSRQYPCASETVSLNASTTCGEPAAIRFTSTTACTVKVKGGVGSGLPLSGTVELHNANVVDAGVLRGFTWMRDGGVACVASPGDGGLVIDCAALKCGGTLMP